MSFARTASRISTVTVAPSLGPVWRLACQWAFPSSRWRSCRGQLPSRPWQHLFSSFGYTLGFLIVVLGRQQLFTESTLTAVLPVLLPGSGPARPLIIIILTYVVAVSRFSHVIAGSAEAAFAFFLGHATATDYAWRFLLPTLVGNTIGGVALVALLNHAPLATEA
jgi:formate/nitrite transporter FocA (FNT family)